MFNVKNFGLNTLGKIKNNNFNDIDKNYTLIDLVENNNINEKDIIIKNTLESDPIFFYKVTFNDNTSQILTSSSSYSLSILVLIIHKLILKIII